MRKFNEEEKDKKDVIEKRRTRSMENKELKDLELDSISTFWMKVENNECYDEMAIYTVEIPVKAQNTPKVEEAKQKDLQNMCKYRVFEEVDDIGQDRIGSRWVITQKEKADGQKSDIKGRLVARGFQEQKFPQ